MNRVDDTLNQQKRQIFPQRLHSFLEIASSTPELSWIVSWCPDRESFAIYDPLLLAETILPVYFQGMNSFKSFRRQLHLYGIIKKYDHRGREGITSSGKIRRT